MKVDEMPAGRELDALVAGKVMGSPFQRPRHGNCCTCQTCGFYHDECQCGYSEDIGMAWIVVEVMRQKHGHLDLEWYDEWDCTIGGGICASAETAPLAICRAALKAVGIKEV